MIRLTLYIVTALSISLIAAWVASNPGQIIITWQGWEIRTTIAVFIFFIVLYTAAILASLKLLKWLNILSYLSSPQRLAGKRKKGALDLDQAWSALALGDHEQAIKMGLRAKSKLGEDHNVLRLLASATKQSGKIENPYFEALKSAPHSAPWVLKQELDQLIELKSWEEALPIANKMLSERPGNRYLAEVQLMLLAHLGLWHDAKEALNLKGGISPSQKAHLKAMVEYCIALEEKAAGRKIEAQALTKSALKKDPKFGPAAILSARLYLEQGDQKEAGKILNAIWKRSPNSEIANMLIDLNPLESATETYRRIKSVSEKMPEHTERQQLLARAAIDAGHWPEARQALELNIASGKPTKTTYQLLAQLERKQKNDDAAAQKFVVLSEALKDDSPWVCRECLSPTQHYVPVCSTCQEFDSLINPSVT